MPEKRLEGHPDTDTMPESSLEDALAAALAERDKWRKKAEGGQVSASGLNANAIQQSKRYGLVWEDQPEPRTEQEVRTTLPSLTHNHSLSLAGHLPDSARPHILIEGENLHALLALQVTHKGKIDVIYIDPPYNTGSKDFRYNDSFVGQDDNYRHSKWLTFMHDRLALAKTLLAKDGFVAVSIDDNEMPRLVLLLEEIFGASATQVIAVKMSEAAGVKMASVKNAGKIPKLKEYLIIAKPGGVSGLCVETIPKDGWDDNYRTFLDGMTPDLREEITSLTRQPGMSESDRSRLERRLAHLRLVPVRQAAIAAGIEPRDRSTYDRWRIANAWRISQDTNGGGSIMSLVEDRRASQDLPNQDVCAVLTPTGLIALALTKNGRTILLADEHLTTHPGDFWNDISTTSLSTEGGVEFRNGKKPLALLRRIIGAHPKTDAIVLDFFAGSGSTGEAVAQLNEIDGGVRQAILVTNNEAEICRAVTQPRLAGCFGPTRPDGRSREPLPGSLAFYEVTLVEKSENRDITRARMAENIAGILAIRENTHMVATQDGPLTRLEGPEKVVLAWTDLFDTFLMEDAFREFRDSGEAGDREVVVYAASWDATGGQTLKDLAEEFPGWRFEPIPDLILEELEKAQRQVLRMRPDGQ